MAKKTTKKTAASERPTLAPSDVFDLDVPSSAQLPIGFAYGATVQTEIGPGRLLRRERDGASCFVRDVEAANPTTRELEEAIARAQAREAKALAAAEG